MTILSYVIAVSLLLTSIPTTAQEQEELNAQQRKQLLDARNELWKEALGLLKEGKPAAARPLLEQVLDIEQRVLGPHHADVISSLDKLAETLLGLEDFLAAIGARRQRLEALKQALPKGHWRLSDAQWDLRNAEFLESMTAQERKKLRLADELDRQGFSAYQQSNLVLAIDKFQEALTIRQGIYAGSHPKLANSLSDLGFLHLKLGDYAVAKLYCDEAFAMCERLYPSDAYPGGHPALAQSLNNLAGVLESQGEYESARKRFEQVLAMRESLYPSEEYPKGHAALVRILNNLGGLLKSQGEYEAALEYYKHALAMCERLFSPDRYPEGHPELARGLNNLGAMLVSLDEYEVAHEYYERALAMRERLYSEENYPAGHPELAGSLCNLAHLFELQGERAAAHQYYERALAMYGQLFPRGHPVNDKILASLGVLDLGTDNSLLGVLRLLGAFWMEISRTQDLFAQSSQQTMRSYLATTEWSFDVLLSAARQLNEKSSDAAAEAMQAVLARKTIVADTLLRMRMAERFQAENPEIAATALNYRATRQLLANLSISALDDQSPEARAELMSELEEKSNQLQVTLNRALSSHTGEPPPLKVDLGTLRRQLADDEAIVELVRFDLFDFTASGDEQRWQPPRYLAFVLNANVDTPPQLIDLGEAEPIDEAVAGLRKHIETIPRQLQFSSEEGLEDEYRELAGELSRQVFMPLHEALDDARRIYLSPDGELNRIAFEALTDAEGKYLIERYQFVYLSGGRDLLLEDAEPATGTIVFASPDYDFRVVKQSGATQPQPTQAPAEQLASVFPGDRSFQVRGLNWNPLPATVEEAARIDKSLANSPDYGPVTKYMQAEALESRLKQITPPRVLHLATHGFYLADQQHERSELPFFERGAGASTTTAADLARLGNLENPLLRSGIVLAGANRLGEETDPENRPIDDGWVTAEEIGLLNLRGTELVVLSACETGLGDIRTGEGVAGLRRAFFHAGVQTLVTSLYKVPDEATQELMIDFYGRLAAGSNKLEALHDAQLAVINKRRNEHGGAHPFFWASFLLVGDPE